MHKILTILTSVLSLFFTINFKTAHAQLSLEAKQKLQAKLDSCVNNYNLPGISVAVTFPNNETWQGASGFNHIYAQTAMDTSVLFQMASVSKMFTAAIIFQLAEENKLTLEDSIGQHLPPINFIPSKTKIKYLLNHRSGIFDFMAGNPNSANTWFTHPDSIWNSQTAIETYGANPIFQQGNSFSYSNTNYVLLGMLIEQITGNTYAEELKNRIIIPFGLTQTFYPPQDSIVGNYVSGWTSFSQLNVYDTDASVILNNAFYSSSGAAGAIVSYPLDVMKFTRNLLSGQMLNNTSLSTMKTCTNVNFGDGATGYGHGLMRYVFQGKTYFGHGGDINGFTQHTIHSTDNNVTLTVSINRNNAPRSPIALGILKEVAQIISVNVSETNLNEGDIDIYPNPNQGRFTIKGNFKTKESVLIEVFNAAGQIVYTDIKDELIQSYIDLSQHPKGLYIMKISGTDLKLTKKLIIN